MTYRLSATMSRASDIIDRPRHDDAVDFDDPMTPSILLPDPGR
jgi:hypothetical protein